ncbi:alpha/beta fold hydrolase [Nonomuraea sp. NPDC049400]|uniref:alpha/beta fold hydrolase n=1 Tax=Nonomuraea sp. NPDC049400 TaxID=3364352 RepID=UPI0037BCD318
MRSYVLVPGLWAGAWIWHRIARQLRAAGHRARALTLSGLSAPDTGARDVTLADHADDVLSVLIEEDLNDVILVAHDYGGIVAGSVVDRAPERVAHTVYVEAFLAHDGRSMLDAFPAGVRAEELRLIADNDGLLPPPPIAAVADGQDLSPGDARWLTKRFVGHPGRSLSDPATLGRPSARHPATYVMCEMDHFAGSVGEDIDRLRDEPGWTFRTLRTGRWPMLSVPGELAELLLDVDRTVGAVSAETAAGE